MRQKAIFDGWSPISQFQAEDIFIVSYPKSGATWFQNLIAGVVYGVNTKFSPPALTHELTPDVHYNAYYRRYATTMLFKSHALPCPDYRRVVYLLRDGRDVMVSYHRYREAIDKTKIDFLKFVSPETDLFPCHWGEHADAWAKNPHAARILLIKYEDLVHEPVKQLERFCLFAGIVRDAEHLLAVAETNSFRNLREKEAQMGFGRADHAIGGPFFFRRGVVGSHKDEMPPEVAKVFLSHAGETLRRCGYLNCVERVK
ncbi:MAG: sulfotransferase domain-containing protein [Methylocella sp.]